MSRFLPVLFLIGLFFFMWLFLYAHQRREKQKRALPLREDYLVAHGHDEPACFACGKDQLPSFNSILPNSPNSPVT